MRKYRYCPKCDTTMIMDGEDVVRTEKVYNLTILPFCWKCFRWRKLEGNIRIQPRRK